MVTLETAIFRQRNHECSRSKILVFVGIFANPKHSFPDKDDPYPLRVRVEAPIPALPFDRQPGNFMTSYLVRRAKPPVVRHAFLKHIRSGPPPIKSRFGLTYPAISGNVSTWR